MKQNRAISVHSLGYKPDFMQDSRQVPFQGHFQGVPHVLQVLAAA